MELFGLGFCKVKVTQSVLFIPDPWINIEWKKTVSPVSISRWTRGASGAKVKVTYLPETICFVHPRSMDQYWMEEDRVTSIHLQVDTRSIRVKGQRSRSLTFLNPSVLFIPDPWINIGWKKTVSPVSISRWTRGASGSKVMVTHLPETICFVHPRSMDQYWVEEDGVTSIHLQVDTRSIGVKGQGNSPSLIHLFCSSQTHGSKLDGKRPCPQYPSPGGHEEHRGQRSRSLTFLNPSVLFIPDPWINIGWKKTVSPVSISRWTRGASGSKVMMPWYKWFTPPWNIILSFLLMTPVIECR